MTDEDPVDLEEAQQQVQEKRLLEELDRNGELEQLKELLSVEPMRDFMWRILGKCHIYESTYQRNFGDMALLEGKRQVGLWLLSEICEADPQAEIAMKQKANQLAHAAAQKQAATRARRRRPT